MKHIILITIIAAAAIGVIVWFQARPVDDSRISVTNGVNDFAQEVQAIDIGTMDSGFQAIDADILQL